MIENMKILVTDERRDFKEPNMLVQNPSIPKRIKKKKWPRKHWCVLRAKTAISSNGGGCSFGCCNSLLLILIL